MRQQQGIQERQLYTRQWKELRSREIAVLTAWLCGFLVVPSSILKPQAHGLLLFSLWATVFYIYTWRWGAFS